VAITTGCQSAGNAPGDLDLSGLDRALRQIYRTRALIGTIPPAPATARGRFGAVLVRLVQRALFWFFPQLDAFHGAVIEFSERQMVLMEELRLHLASLDAELARARQDWAGLSDVPADEGEAAELPAELWMQIARCQAGIETVRQSLERNPI
jgi:hypothetical protein